MATKAAGGAPSLTFEQFKQARLASACKHAWIINCGTHGASALRSLTGAAMNNKPLLDIIPEVLHTCLCLALLSLPVMAASSAHLQWVQPATIISHLVRTVIACAPVLGWFPMGDGLRNLLHNRLELPIEMAIAYRDQMSVSVMAVLHGLRQAGCAALLVCHMDVDPYHAVMRCIVNWAVLVMVAAAFEYRTRSCWAKYQAKQRQLDETPDFASPLPSPDKTLACSKSSYWEVEDKPGSSPCASGGAASSRACQPEQDYPPCASDMFASFASLAGWAGGQQPARVPVAPMNKAFSGVAEGFEFPLGLPVPAQEVADEPRRDSACSLHGSDVHASKEAKEMPILCNSGPDDAMLFPSGPTGAIGPTIAFLDSGGKPAAFLLENEAVTEPELVPGRMQPMPTTAAPAAHAHRFPGIEPRQLPTGVRAAGASLHRPGMVAGSGTAGHQPVTGALSRIVDQQRPPPYRRNRGGKQNAVHVKVKGIELENLPPDLPKLMHEQLSVCMPGVAMTGLTLRSGCVMMTLDLMHNGDTRNTTRGMASLMNWLMQTQTMGQSLEDGSALCIQTPGELVLSQWNKDAGHYASVAGQTLDIQGLAQGCQLLSAQPAVLCLPGGLQEPASRPNHAQQVTLVVQLQFPDNCRLHGWQPAGVAAPADPDEHVQSFSEEGGSAVNAMLLARRLDGGYLPVVVKRVDTCLGLEVAQVTLTLDGAAPAALQLELWCKTRLVQPPTPGIPSDLDVLVSHTPLLVLPSSCKEAAAELQQHLEFIRIAHVPTPCLTHVASNSALCSAATMRPPILAAATQCDVSDSASSLVSRRHNSVCDMPPAESSEQDASQALLEDLCYWLTHYTPAAGSICPGGLAVGPGSEVPVSQLGEDLLVYAVQQGLGALAGMIVHTMQRGEQQVHGNSSSAWLLGAACGREETSVLHAAMASGNPDVLAQVLSWGTKYGGPDWAWPWELEDATGCTPLHLAAAQPADGACAALLKTITCMLPAAQAQAAHNAWFHCQGRVGITPANLLKVTSPSPSDVWGSDKGSSQIRHADPAACSSSVNSREMATPITCLPASRSMSSPSQITGKDQSWLDSVIAVWRVRETAEQRAWAKKQVSQIKFWWVATTIVVCSACAYRSAMTGCLKHELLHISLQGVAYMPMVATSSLNWLGNCQAWLLSPYVFYCLSYWVKASLPSAVAPLWAAAGKTGAEALYVIVFDASMDQAPLPWLLVARAVVAYFESLAYRAIGVRCPLLCALLVQSAALAFTMLCRARQLRAFHGWQAKEARGKALAGSKGTVSLQEEEHCAGSSSKKDN